jgi:hemoglobin-like flavoprotein
MNPDDVSWIELTWKRVSGSPEAVAELFYNELFTRNPELRALFKGDMREQGKKLMGTLAFVVSNLLRPEELRAPVEQLGRRHKDYGVLPAHYGMVGAALMATLHKDLGPELTPEAEQAWSGAISAIAERMIEAAESE